MEDPYVDAGWPRLAVSTTPPPEWPLAEAEHGWLLLEGLRIPTLPEDIRKLATPFSYHWIWRSTPDEYSAPGYQAGPLLVALNETLLERFVNDWGPKQAGVMLLAPQSPAPLLLQLRKLKQLSAADGQPVALRWSDLRTLEELCEALQPARLAHLFQPIQTLRWYSEQGQWLRMDLPDSPSGALDTPVPCLTLIEENALIHAAHAWFMRDCCSVIEKPFHEPGDPQALLAMRRQIAQFDREAVHFGFRLERDRLIYVNLRLRFPLALFKDDTTITGLLSQTQVLGIQRLIALNGHLHRTSEPVLRRHHP